jgi:DNA-binding IclR family transcriptional regulator
LVRERPGGISRGELCKAIGGTSSNVDRACKRLVQLGYIRLDSSKDYATYYPSDGVVG